MRRGRGIGWTGEEDNILCDLIAANASDTLMRARLKRSPEAIKMRILKLQKKSESKNDNARPARIGKEREL